MASRRKLLNLINQSVQEQPINKAFLTDVMQAIEQKDLKGRRKSSKWYKPSSFVCMRQMYFTRIQEEQDGRVTDYQGIGMADTGTRRHEAIQDVLLEMEDMGYDWRYIDVAEYIKEKEIPNLTITGVRGAETKLFHEVLLMSFMCDGIVQRISTGEYYLFEFKNQISFKYNNKEAVDPEHIDQVSCYCTCLDLDKALVVYENRDVCALECPEEFEVTSKMKQGVIDKVMECEGYVERLIPPPVERSTKLCRWCNYKIACEKAGD